MATEKNKNEIKVETESEEIKVDSESQFPLPDFTFVPNAAHLRDRKILEKIAREIEAEKQK
jgi:hypothetical protein